MIALSSEQATANTAPDSSKAAMVDPPTSLRRDCRSADVKVFTIDAHLAFRIPHIPYSYRPVITGRDEGVFRRVHVDRANAAA